MRLTRPIVALVILGMLLALGLGIQDERLRSLIEKKNLLTQQITEAKNEKAAVETKLSSLCLRTRKSYETLCLKSAGANDACDKAASALATYCPK